MKRQPRAMSREERQTQIWRLFISEAELGRQPWLTTYDIAKRLDMRRSSHLDRIVREMVMDGDLDMREQLRPGRWAAFEYRLHADYFNQARPTRQLKLRYATGEEIIEWL